MPEIGKNWPSRFLERHPELDTAWSRPLDIMRAYTATSDRVESFLFRLMGLRADCGNEKGFVLGSEKRT